MPSSASPALFPLFLDLRGRRVLVVGGGSIATRKVPALLEAGAEVIVGAPDLTDNLRNLKQQAHITHLVGSFTPEWLNDVWLVIAATNHRSVNQVIADAAHARKLWVNVVDDAELTSAQLSARVQRGPLQVAISSGGASPMLARHLREQLEQQLDESLGALAERLAGLRARIRQRFPNLATRRAFFERILRGPVPTLLRRGQTLAAQHAIESELHATPTPPRGSVALVGAGPGDAGLLTLRALRVLNEADVILYDRLVSQDVLALARRDALQIEVGKRVGEDHDATQQHIHRLMIEHANTDKRVVRLKGGDSFVFGRGGEELEALQAEGIAFEVVPGITAATACAAYAGIPLTHREYAQSLHILTARARNGEAEHDWAALAKAQQTLVFYMGVSGLSHVRERLIAHGRSSDTPFALVENGSRPQQRVIAGTLAQLPELAQQHAVQAPALLIIGEVAALAQRLHWFGSPPLVDTHERCSPSPLARAA